MSKTKEEQIKILAQFLYGGTKLQSIQYWEGIIKQYSDFSEDILLSTIFSFGFVMLQSVKQTEKTMQSNSTQIIRIDNNIKEMEKQMNLIRDQLKDIARITEKINTKMDNCKD